MKTARTWNPLMANPRMARDTCICIPLRLLDSCCLLCQSFPTFFSTAAHPNLSHMWRYTVEFLLTTSEYENIGGGKYISAYKSLPYKNVGTLKRSITRVE
jgi:hypothetical protein